MRPPNLFPARPLSLASRVVKGSEASYGLKQKAPISFDAWALNNAIPNKLLKNSPFAFRRGSEPDLIEGPNGGVKQ
jgi:hypothetical protein